MVDIPTTDTVSGEIPNGNLMLVLDPASDTPKTQSYSDLKANIRAGLTGGGGSSDTSALSAIVNHLSEVTADLALHEQTHVWARTTQSTSTEGYYWDTSGQNTQASARSNGIWANHQTNFPANAEIYFLVVIPGGSNASTPKPDDYRVLLNSSEGTAYPLLVSHMRSIGENAAGTLSYFTATEPVDTGELTSVELQKQTLTSTGSTKYSGELDRSTAYAAIKEIIVGGTDNDTDETVTLSAGSGGGGSRPTITRVNPTTSQDNTTNGRLAGTVWASDTPARAAVSAISSTADGDMAIYRVFAFATTDAVVVFLRQGASWFQIANVEVSSSRTSGAVFSEERPLEPGQATLVVPGNGIPGREANDATFLDLTTGLVSERIRLIDFSAVHDSDLEPGYIERAQGHDFPDTVSVQWQSGEVPPVTILSPLTFVKPVVPGMIIGLEIVATGGGGGIAPVLTMDLRNSDGEVISTAITVERTGELGYHQLEVTDRTVGPVTLALEGVDGSDSGAFTIEIVDVLAFTGTGSAARLIAQVADRIINLGEGAPEMGITSDEAIALINQLVPAAQRIPPLAGHGSALAQVAPDASAVHLVQPTTIADSVTAAWAQPGQDRPGTSDFSQLGVRQWRQPDDFGGIEWSWVSNVVSPDRDIRSEPLDADRHVRDAIIFSNAHTLGRSLVVSGTVEWFIAKNTPDVPTSGSIGVSEVRLIRWRSSDLFREVLHTYPSESWTLAEFNARGTSYAASPNRTQNLAVTITALPDLHPTDDLRIEMLVNGVNGHARIKAELSALTLTLPGAY